MDCVVSVPPLKPLSLSTNSALAPSAAMASATLRFARNAGICAARLPPPSVTVCAAAVPPIVPTVRLKPCGSSPSATPSSRTRTATVIVAAALELKVTVPVGKVLHSPWAFAPQV